MTALLLAAALSCPDDQVIGLDLPKWKKSMLADKPGSDEQHQDMAALRMKTVPDGAQSEDDCFDKPKVEGSRVTGLEGLDQVFVGDPHAPVP